MSGNRFAHRFTWPQRILQTAGIYNLVWGTGMVVFPSAFFRWLELDSPNYPQIWQCLGIMVGVYGVGYLLAASDPARQWPIVLVGLLGKFLGPLGFVWNVMHGTLSWRWLGIILANDVVWWVPFAAVLYHAFRQNSSPAYDAPAYASLDEALHSAHSHRGATLNELSAGRGVLVVFLRHSGCMFCREALAELAAQRPAIEACGVQLAIVHMGTPLEASKMSACYELEDLHRFSDPDGRLYSVFGLRRGGFRQLLGLAVWRRGLRAALVEGHGLGRIAGDTFRLAGAFLISSGKVVAAFRAETAADKPNYLALSQCVNSVILEQVDCRRATFPRPLASVV